MLALQLEDRNQDVEMLEARMPNGSNTNRTVQNAIQAEGYSLSQNARPRTLDDPATPLDEDYDDSQKELFKASATLAEQLITIRNLEEIVAEDNELLEKLQNEKGKLNQKLSLMQQIRGEYDNQTAEYEKLLKSHQDLKEKFAVIQNSSSNAEQLEALQFQHDRESSELKIQLSTMKNTAALMQQDIERLMQEKSEMMEQIRAMETSPSGNNAQDALYRIEDLENANRELVDENKMFPERLEDSLDTEWYIQRIQQLEDALTIFATQKEQMVFQLQSYREMEEDYREHQAIRQDLENKLAQVDAEVDFMQSEFDQKVRELIVFETEVKQSKADQLELIQEKDDRIEKLMEDIKMHDKVVNELRFQMNARSASPTLPPKDVPPKDDLLSKSQDGLAGLVTQLNAAEVEIDDLKSKLDERGGSSSDTYLTEIRSKNLEIEELHKDLEEMEERLVRLLEEKGKSTGNDSLQKELDVLHSERDNLWAEMDQMEKGYQNEINDLRNRLESLPPGEEEGGNTRSLDLEAVIEQLKDEKSRLEGNHIAETVEMASLQEEITVIRQQLYELQQAPTPVSSSPIQELLQVKTNELQSLQEDNEILKKKLNSLVEEMKSSSYAPAQLAESGQETSSVISNNEGGLLQEIEQLKSTIQKKSDDSTEEIKSISSLLEERRVENSDLLVKISLLSTSLDDLNGELEYQNGILEEALKQNEKLETEIVSLRNLKSDSTEVKALQQKLMANERELVELRTCIANEPKLVDLEMMNNELMEKILTCVPNFFLS